MFTISTLRGSEPVVRQVGSDSTDVEEVSLLGSLDHLKKRLRSSGTTGEQQEHASQSCCVSYMFWLHAYCLHQALAGDRELAERHGEKCSSWWGWRGLNPHVGCPTQDFKSCAYANFATSPLIFSWLRFGIIPRRRGEPQA